MTIRHPAHVFRNVLDHDIFADVIDGQDPHEALLDLARHGPRRFGELVFRLDADFIMMTCGYRGIDENLANFMESELLDPRTNHVVASIPKLPLDGGLRHIAQFANVETWYRSPAYYDFTAKAGVHDAGLMLNRHTTGFYVVVTGVLRGTPWYDDEEATSLSRFHRHLTHAIDLHTRLRLAETAGGQGTIVADRKMRPVRIFDRKPSFESVHGCLSVSARGITTRKPDQRERLEAAAASIFAAREPGACRRLVLSDECGKFHLVALARGPDVPFGPTLTIACEPVRRASWSHESLRAIFAATPREADIILMLLAGAETAEMVTALGIGPETIKTHMSGIYRKTGARSRLHLASMLLGG